MNEAGQKRALVTGAANGLGKAMCDRLLNEGWEVVGIDLAATQEAGEINMRVCDLSERARVDKLMDGLETGEPFDLVIHNAGINATGRFDTLPLEAHRKLLCLNVETPMIMTARLAATGRLRSGGNLAFISSLSHFTGYPGAASYAASKDAIAIYAKSIRKPFAKMGITVSCVFPGPLRTEHAERHSPADTRAEHRMAPETAAAHILVGIAKGKSRIIPSRKTGIFALLGRVAPWASDRAMRRAIFDKLDQDVY